MRRQVLACFAAGAMLLACGDDDDPQQADAPNAVELTRGSRYCEVLAVFPQQGGLLAKVWGTQTLSYCPEDAWDALESDAIQAELGALFVKMNGPRYWLVDKTTGEAAGEAERRKFGDLDMILVATIDLDPDVTPGQYYVEAAINRTTTYHFWADAEIYELFAPDGSTYVMQAYSQIIDPELVEADLPLLGDRLALPEGWSFAPRTLETELVLEVTGQAILVQDELENSYQRRIEGSAGP